MTATIPVQYSTKIELGNAGFSEVLVCFIPLIRAGQAPSWKDSYVKFIFTPKNGGRSEEVSFLPVSRWTADHYAEWRKTLARLPVGTDIERVFDDACLDLVL